MKLAQIKNEQTLVFKARREVGSKIVIVTACLNKIGGQKPYFSVTADVIEGVHRSMGCCHEDVLEFFPELAPIVALHLADEDGEPMHGEANGFYWIAGACGGLGEEYHGGKERTTEVCLDIFANHMRITKENALDICETVKASENPREAWKVIYAEDQPRRARQAYEGKAYLNQLIERAKV